jgi:hypothetical protein
VEHLIEAEAEVGVAERVEDRVLFRVDVAEQRDRRHDVIADTREAEWNDNETDEVAAWQPAAYTCRASYNIVNLFL